MTSSGRISFPRQTNPRFTRITIGPVFFGKIRRLEIDHAVKGTVDAFPRLNLANIKPVKDFNQRMNRVLEIVSPLGDPTALALFLGRTRKLFVQSVEMVVKVNQVVNERFLERFVQEIVAIFQQLPVQ